MPRARSATSPDHAGTILTPLGDCEAGATGLASAIPSMAGLSAWRLTATPTHKSISINYERRNSGWHHQQQQFCCGPPICLRRLPLRAELVVVRPARREDAVGTQDALRRPTAAFLASRSLPGASAGRPPPTCRRARGPEQQQAWLGKRLTVSGTSGLMCQERVKRTYVYIDYESVGT